MSILTDMENKLRETNISGFTRLLVQFMQKGVKASLQSCYILSIVFRKLGVFGGRVNDFSKKDMLIPNYRFRKSYQLLNQIKGKEFSHLTIHWVLGVQEDR